MTRLLPILTTLSLMAALTACSQEKDKQTAPTNTDSAGAEGEVLEGSISDAMIPLDQLTSTSPSAEIESDETSGENGTNSGEASTESGEAEGTDPVSGGESTETVPPAPEPATQSAPASDDNGE